MGASQLVKRGPISAATTATPPIGNLRRTNSDFCEISCSPSRGSSPSEEGESYGERKIKVINVPEYDGFPNGSELEREYGYYILMDVGEPVTITSKEAFFSSTFTTYLIRAETNYPTFTDGFSSVRRRYAEFTWLREQLVKNHPKRDVPTLPPKKFFPFMNFQPAFIQQRLKGLGRFLKRVLEIPAFLRDPSLQFFMESELSVQEMEGIKRNVRKDVAIEEVEVVAAVSSSLNQLLNESISPTEDEDDEEDEEVDVAENSISSLPSEKSEGSSGANAKLNLPQLPLPIPIPGKKNNCHFRAFKMQKLLDEETEGTLSSDGDSGHFEGFSSATASASPSENANGTTTTFPRRRSFKSPGGFDYFFNTNGATASSLNPPSYFMYHPLSFTLQ